MTTRREFIHSAAALGGALALAGPSAALAQTPAGSAPGGGAPTAPDETIPAATGPGAPGQHELPPLPYAYDALEPYIDAQTMQIHHDKHHAAYVKGLNTAEIALADARKMNHFEFIAFLETALSFNGSGHANHTIFWTNMAPKGKAKAAPTGDLMDTISRDFGSLDTLKAQFSEAAVRVEGSGWGVLAWHPALKHLYTISMLNHQNHALNGAIPILVCDVWEHAYYLKYQNKRSDYIVSWWNVVDWANVEGRFSAARQAG